MTQSELIEEIYQRLPPYYRLKLPRTKIRMVIESLMDVIIERLIVCEPIQFRRYGTLDPSVVTGRKYRDRDTNEIKPAEPYLAVRFRIARKWRDLSKRMIRGKYAKSQETAKASVS